MLGLPGRFVSLQALMKIELRVMKQPHFHIVHDLFMVNFFSNKKLDLSKVLRFGASGPLNLNFRHATLYQFLLGF